MDKKGKPVKKMGVGDDVAKVKRKDLRESLEESEEKYRHIVELSQDLIAIHQKGKIVFINEAGLRLLGAASPDQVIGRPVTDFVSQDGQKIARERIRRLMEEGKAPVYEQNIRRLDGMELDIEISGIPFAYRGETAVQLVGRDITRRKKAEDEISRLNERLTLATRAAGMGVWDWDVVRNELIWDKQMYSLYGLKPGDFSGAYEAWAKSVHADDRERCDRESRQAQLGEKEYDTEFRVVWPDGTIRHIAAKGDVFRDEEGKPLRMIGVNWDITRRKMIEDKLRESEEMFSSAFYTGPTGMTITRIADGKIIYANETFCSMLEFSHSEVIGHLSTELKMWTPEARNNLIQKQIESGGLQNFELPVRTKSGRLITVLFSSREMDVNGEKCHFTNMIDITERKQAEKTLQDTYDRMSKLISTSPGIVCSFRLHPDGSACFPDGYKRLAEHFGIPQARLDEDAAPFFALVHPDDLDTLKESIAESGRLLCPFRHQWRVRHPVRGELWVDAHSMPLYEPGGSILWHGVTNDITDLRRLEEEIRRVQKLESVGLLAGGIAHDFNNILTSILGNISLAKMESEPGSNTYKSMEQAEKASQRARDLTRQLLTFSKGGSPVKKLASLLDIIHDTAIFALRGSNVKCNFSIPVDLWHTEVDVGQISQVIHNLVINAQQAMPAGGTIELSAENILLHETQSIGRGLPLSKGRYIRVSVADHGSGIPAEHLSKIFDPFFTTKVEGSGLGLASAFSIARNHDGHLSVESKVGSGSTFYLYLPASMEMAVPLQDKTAPKKVTGKTRILFMDDEKGIRDVAGRMLQHIGYHDVEFAVNGAEAIDKYTSAMESGHPFSAVILDLTIPGGMSGTDTIRELLKIDNGVRAIVSSGYAEKSAMAEYWKYGFLGMVAKPYTLEELGKVLQDVIG